MWLSKHAKPLVYDSRNDLENTLFTNVQHKGMRNYAQLFYVEIITYPCPGHNAGLVGF